jgi:hypothetical protein
MSLNIHLIDQADLLILNLIGKWKVVCLKDLASECEGMKLGYHALAKRARKLENFGYIKSKSLAKKRKYFYLIKKGIKYADAHSAYEISTDSLNHDILLGNTVRSFLKNDLFISGKLYNCSQDRDLDPDGALYTHNNLRIAVELELTQKENSRVRSKYVRYYDSRIFDYCFYVITKPTIYKSYVRYLEMMLKDVIDKIVIIKTDNLRGDNLFNENTIGLFNGNELGIFEIFQLIGQNTDNLDQQTYSPAVFY